jgi:hypothetical protein
MKKRFTPALEMNVPGFGKSRQEFLEGFQWEMAVFPAILVERARTVDTSGVTIRGDFHLDPVPSRKK